jgi:uncharacterized protein YegP (UPF0339 family)
MTATFEIKRTADGKYVFNLKSANDQVILTSQSYENKEAAEAGISSVRHNAILDEQYEEKIESDGHPYFVLFAVNRKEIGRSQMYSSREAMRKGIASVKRNSQIAVSVDLSARVRTAGGEMAGS